jgi:hypothetical protein
LRAAPPGLLAMNFVHAHEAAGRKTGPPPLPAGRDHRDRPLVFDFAIESRRAAGDADYRGYRNSICTSINHVVCHGIPDDKPLREGDIVNIDVT